MKKLLLISIFMMFPWILQANDTNSDHEIILKQVAEIKPARTGVRSSAVQRTKSPFLLFTTITKKGKTKRAYVEKKKRVKLLPLKLESAINKNVKINGKWYKEGDRIRQYTIIKVDGGEALLKSKKKEIKLYLNTKNEKINFNVK